MRVLFAGTPETALPCLHALLDSEHEVVGVLTRPDARRGRGRALQPSPVAALARKAGLDVRTPTTLRDPGVGEWVRSLDLGVAVVVAYGRLVPPTLLEVPDHGWLNLHFSLLPSWRGAAPVQRAVLAGEEVTGVSVFRLEEGLDSGPVYARLPEPVGPQDTSGDLLGRLAATGAPLVLDVLRCLAEGTARAQPQDGSRATLAPALTAEEGRIRWAEEASTVARQVRGVTPAPGAYTTFQGRRLLLGSVVPVPPDTVLQPGQLRVSKHEVLVGTGSCAVRLGRVAPAGRSWMDAEDWARGARPPQGSFLGTEPRVEDEAVS
ncbi:methionyl-tRNA formyltransferase [Actinomyces lilanjuaniae]|uniref:Methionyl-tRNA formyltransferase n=1 Tax=Actinomyces lilanjuaniae TaxID=2321394 RepID=A0ABN5PRR8_9ACTO|nr:methionyl-tRNA formyltransferase [Actinomyces lilanjuaniae]AYD89777.1 methionyl-tRNA formyltransferase [Actinomyces lilanjuaniae]